jgi:hypothetical protein
MENLRGGENRCRKDQARIVTERGSKMRCRKDQARIVIERGNKMKNLGAILEIFLQRNSSFELSKRFYVITIFVVIFEY